MVRFEKTFRTADHAEPAVPEPGRHILTCRRADTVESQAGHKMLRVVWGAGDSECRQFFNLWHPTPMVSRIANTDLSRVLEALGLKSLKDTDSMLGRRASAEIYYDNDRRYARFRRWEQVAEKTVKTKKAKKKKTAEKGRVKDADIPF